MLDLTDDELSALIEACNVAGRGSPRPPWDRAGISAWRKLIDEELYRGGLICEHGIRDGQWCEDCNKAYKEARHEAGYE